MSQLMIRFEAQFNNASQILKTQNLENPPWSESLFLSSRNATIAIGGSKKIGFMSPLELRQAYNKRMAA